MEVLSLSHITEDVRKKRETKIEQFLALPSKGTHHIEWSKQPEKKLSKHIFVVRHMMLARLKSHCSRKEGQYGTLRLTLKELEFM